eukprot:gnl/TRDRNA2_/TRDRNA2_155212_c1_seq1.p1 gnl/TRDRNA2_/TRDRNA2_155212_c1~~gnl/TRDRNA2_/TRDRNA2_155212_c1_seq1.p1  ORF type:complete len:396 (+),score=75.21 gnl/TRDRNA2_/TRDRNA2_155212_c1_seq1:106-1188(+)
MISIPLIESSPLLVSSILFLVLACVNLGVMNLLLSAIVDRAQQIREDDMHLKLTEKCEQFKAARTELMKYCQQMDTDKSGELTLEEFLNGYKEFPDFASHMELMDIRFDDMCMVFDLVDSDKTGSVSYDEFVDELYSMKTTSERTMFNFIRYHLNEIRRDLKVELTLMQEGHARQHELLMQHVEKHGATQWPNGKVDPVVGSGEAAAPEPPPGVAGITGLELEGEACQRSDMLIWKEPTTTNFNAVGELRRLQKQIDEHLSALLRDLQSDVEDRAVVITENQAQLIASLGKSLTRVAQSTGSRKQSPAQETLPAEANAGCSPSEPNCWLAGCRRYSGDGFTGQANSFGRLPSGLLLQHEL